MSSNLAPRTAAHGHPPGLYLVSFTEMWERFSYYGISALFVLYLTAPVSGGGFGWPAQQAVSLYGLYAGLAFAGPAVGGWISSSFLGERRCIAIGGSAIMLGHLLLGGPALLPASIERATDVPVQAILANAGIEHGRLLLSPAIMEVLGRAAGTAADSVPPAVTAAYLCMGWSFILGLGCVIAGTALIKPTISSIVGKLYAADDPRRVFGFTLFMTGIWAGALASNFVAGTLGEKLGWHYGFMAASVGMAIGLIAYFTLQHRLLGATGHAPDRAQASATPWQLLSATTQSERTKLVGILVMSLFTVVYSIAFYQQFGALSLFAKSTVDLNVLGFEVPVSWLLSVSTGAFLAFAPMVGARLTRRAERGKPLDATVSLSCGLGAIACGYVVLALAVQHHVAAQGTKVPIEWFVLAYTCFGIGDVFIWPAQLAIVTALAPKSMTSFAVGSWYVTVGAGNYIAGLVGSWGDRTGIVPMLWWLLAMLVVAILGVLALRNWFAARCTPDS